LDSFSTAMVSRGYVRSILIFLQELTKPLFYVM
jgi:hypothetical protein